MIEQLKKEDFLKIQEIEKKFPQLLVDFPVFSKNNVFTNIYTLTIKKQIIGCIVIDTIYERMELLQIEVLIPERKKGYGSQLIKFMINKATKEKMQNITLEVRIDNKAAIHLYKKYGFREVAIRKKYYREVDGILMERKMM